MLLGLSKLHHKIASITYNAKAICIMTKQKISNCKRYEISMKIKQLIISFILVVSILNRNVKSWIRAFSLNSFKFCVFNMILPRNCVFLKCKTFIDICIDICSHCTDEAR